MNKKLRFSWGHILAFLALIFVAYVTFMGITYYTLGNFMIAGIGAVVCLLLLALFMLGAQVKKGVSEKYYKSIIWERILILMSPIILILAFYPYNHFWTVLDQEKDIVTDFKASVSHVQGVFDEYESYAHQRIDSLDHTLTVFSKESRENRIDELSLLLLSKNYEKLKSEATSWIDNASKGSTVWNVFLLGNVDNIKDAVNKWTNDLSEVSAKHLSTENYEVVNFNAECSSKIEAIQGLDSLKQRYSSRAFTFNVLSVVTMLICFLMLLCPYFIQERNAANCERFWDFWLFSRFFDAKDPVVEYQSVSQSSKDHLQETNNTEINNTYKQKTGKGRPV